jgi:hypothetical protein
MRIHGLLIVAFLMSLASYAPAQEVVVSGFPPGVGGGVGRDFFEPYRSDLKAVADTLHRYPSARAVIVGGADGVRFRENNDAKNPGLALGRAHTLRQWLIQHFSVDSTQLIIQSKDVSLVGPLYRSVSIRVINDKPPSNSRPNTQTVPNPPVSSNSGTTNTGGDLKEHMGLQISAGLSTSPYGAIPFVSGAVTWRRAIFVEGTLGYTLWDGAFRYQGVDLDTRRRMAGGQLIVYPFNRLPLGFVGGWVRVEEIAHAYYAYARLSEGPMFGVRTSIFDFVTITGAYTPVKQRVAGQAISRAKNDQFLLSICVNKIFGGLK